MVSSNIPSDGPQPAPSIPIPSGPSSLSNDEQAAYRASTAALYDEISNGPDSPRLRSNIPSYGTIHQGEMPNDLHRPQDIVESHPRQYAQDWSNEHQRLITTKHVAHDLTADEIIQPHRLLKESIDIACVFSLGHLGALELAASALGSMYISVTGWSVALGMTTALDTLGSQAYTASRNPHALGVYLQRAMLILLWWYAETILLQLGQSEELSALSGRFIRWSIPCLVPYLMFECMKRYLQAQGIMDAGTYILMVTSPINVATNYLLVWWPPIALGFIGAPIAMSLSHWLNLSFAILYVRYVRGGECWGGFSREAFRGWGQFIKLGLSGMAFICSEWWAFEVVALIAGYLGTIPLAAQSVVLTTATIMYMIPAGISITSCNRIGNELGLKNSNRARLACNSALLLGVVVSTFNTSILLIFKNNWGYLFNDDPDVVQLVGDLLPIVALFQIGDVFGGVCAGILRGIGQQHIGAYLTLFGYYVVCFPVGLYLTFNMNMGLIGLWWGLCSALFIVAAGEVWAILRLNWSNEVIRCHQRINYDDVYEEETCIV
ncbi:mate-domain-containing protein [Syncephalis fuscata]|nr:mate-domain-containing protein [Syncephalis fuscata]